ncbi:MAG TPA: hypothetical protein PLD27_06595 [bacterium]|nr:hypothetical protein [bacterium]HOL46555.1 hypothetical protein [bacterium]HPQ17874.1 hypothetical protein [bacterium]
MTFKKHFFLSSVFSIVIFFIKKDLHFSLAFLIGGTFIDIDHCLDYVRETNDYFITLKKMENLFLNFKEKKATIIFHSYELFLILFLLNYFLWNYNFIYALLSGFLFHIILDLIFNPVKFQSYLFLYRLKHSFKKEKILTIF